jgi:DedD protein
MDRAIVERMVGAVVLLVLLVVVAPWLLDGSDNDSDQRELSELASPNETRIETIVLDVAPGSESAIDDQRSSAIPDTVAVTVSEPKPKPKPVVATTPKSTAKPKPVRTRPVAKPVVAKPAAPLPQTQTAAGDFIVQLGVFSGRDNASKFSSRIKAKGFSVKQMQVSTASGTLSRVYVGPRETRAAAEQLVGVMANSGYEGIVIALDGENR